MKNILIAGAGSGIGEAIFKVLPSETHNVYGISRRGEKIQALKPGVNYYCDLKVESEIVSFTSSLKEHIDQLDGLYLTAGDGLFKKITDLTSAEWDEHFNLNVKSYFLLLRELYPLLKKSRKPFVCITSSTAGKQGFPDSSAYCASKHAVAGLAKAIREEWKKDHIRVFTLYLGAISTDIWNDRSEFNREDMISPEDLGKFLSMFTEMSDSINLDEIQLLPIKGIL